MPDKAQAAWFQRKCRLEFRATLNIALFGGVLQPRSLCSSRDSRRGEIVLLLNNKVSPEFRMNFHNQGRHQATGVGIG
jgi:hypothetical protein